jgi:protein TonB
MRYRILGRKSMLHAQDIRPLPRASQQRLAVVAAVGALHLAVIAAFLSGLTSKVFPADPPPPIQVHFVPDKSRPPLPPPADTFTLERPAVPRSDVPVFDTTSGNSTIHETGPTQPVSADPPVRIIGAQPIMGTHTTPDYPALDARFGHEGNVLLKLTIDEWGAVVAAQVERSSGYDSLDRAAASWVKSHWLYHPATRAGDPIPATAEVTVTFRLTTH